MLSYLACPYSHDDPNVREERVQAANRGESWQAWIDLDLAILAHCSRVYVLTLDGWLESWGVRIELELAGALELEVVYLDGEEYGAPAGRVEVVA